MQKTVLITGASRGIGQAIARALHEKGYLIAGVSRNIVPEPWLDLAIRADVGDPSSHDKILSETISRFGRIDLLINNAGMAPEIRSDLLAMNPDSYDRVMNVNLRGPLFLTQAVVNQMLNHKSVPKGPHPMIIFITSISAALSSPERAEYCISKAGLSMAAQLFADRLAPEGVLVYEIRPGIILTDMTAGVKKKYDDRIANGLIPMNRWGTPDDVAQVVVSLSEGSLPYSTGNVIEISGGMNIRHL